MAIRFDASGDSLSRARLAGAKTVMAWAYIATDRNDYTVFFGLGSNELIGTDSDGTTLLYYDGATERTGSALSTGIWYHVAYTSNGDDIGNGFTVYLNGASSITSAVRAQTSAGTNMYLGNDQYSEWLNGRLAHVKVWSAALTAAEILQEMHTIRPQRLANLHSWLPMIATGSDRTNEAGGAGNTWTANGTLTDEAGPPVSWGVAPWVVPFVAAGAGALTGAGAATLAGITNAAAAIIPLTASGAATLAGITSAAAGTIASTGASEGAGAATLAGITSDAAGTIAITATATVTLAGIANAAAGIIPLTATATVTLAGITGEGAGSLLSPLAGAGAVTLAGITGEGAGSLLSPLAGAGAVTLAGIASTGAGIILSPLTGVGAITLAGITGESTGATLTAALIFVIGAVTGGGTRSRATGGGTRSGATGGGTTARVRAIK